MDVAVSFSGKSVLIVSTMSPEYIRIRQIVNLVEKSAELVALIAPKDGAAVRPLTLPRFCRVLLRTLFHGFGKYDAVIFAGMPQMLFPFLRWKLRGKIFVVDFFISIYDTMVDDRGVIARGGLPARFLERLDRVTLLKADRVLTDTIMHSRFFQERFGLDPAKAEVLYIEPDQSVFSPSDPPLDLPEHRGTFKVLFFGAVNPLQGFDQVLKAAALLVDESNIRFLFVGPIESVGEVYRELHLPNVFHLARWMSQKELCSLILGCDLVLVGHFAPGDGKAARVIPGKAYICRALGADFVLGDSPAVREGFSPDDLDVRLVPRGDPKAIADAVLEAYSSVVAPC